MKGFRYSGALLVIFLCAMGCDSRSCGAGRSSEGPVAVDGQGDMVSKVGRPADMVAPRGRELGVRETFSETLPPKADRADVSGHARTLSSQYVPTIVNEYHNEYSGYPEVAALADGGFLVTWLVWGEEWDEPTRLFGRRLSPAGGVEGAEFLIDDDVISGIEGVVSVVSLGFAGAFAVAWVKEDPVGARRVWMRTYDGISQEGSDPHQIPLGDLEEEEYWPMLSLGPHSTIRLVSVRFWKDGHDWLTVTELTPELEELFSVPLVEGDGLGSMIMPSIALLDDGGMAIFWLKQPVISQRVVGGTIMGLVLDSTLSPVGQPFLVSDTDRFLGDCCNWPRSLRVGQSSIAVVWDNDCLCGTYGTLVTLAPEAHPGKVKALEGTGKCSVTRSVLAPWEDSHVLLISSNYSKKPFSIEARVLDLNLTIVDGPAPFVKEDELVGSWTYLGVRADWSSDGRVAAVWATPTGSLGPRSICAVVLP